MIQKIEFLLVNGNGLAISRSRFVHKDNDFILSYDFSNHSVFLDAKQHGFSIDRANSYENTQVYSIFLYLGLNTNSEDNRISFLKDKFDYDLKWYLTIQIDKSEVFQPIDKIDGQMNQQILSIVLIAISVVVVVALISILIANSISKPIVKLSQISQLISNGDLTVEIAKSSQKDEIGELQNSFLTMIEFLKPSVISMSSISKTLASSAQELASSSEEVNASSEEMSSVSQQISKGAQQQSENLNKSIKQIESIEREFEEKINNIKVASDLIENISNQVNMLALNASIEAARAGEYGRGFAVVADNIRRLADDAKSSVGRVNSIMNDFSNSIDKNMSILSSNILSVTTVAEETASGAEEASAATEEQAATMEELSASAQELAKISSDLELIVNKFKVNK